MAGKRGQIKMSFGMIFSIILIVIFLAVAFYAVQKFLELQNTALISKFANDLQSDIDKIWKGNQGNQPQEYVLPKKIKFVCFIDYSSSSNSQIYDDLRRNFYDVENLFFHPLGSSPGFESKEIKHIDLNATTSSENPLCLYNKDGKIELILTKDFGEALVTITR